MAQIRSYIHELVMLVDDNDTYNFINRRILEQMEFARSIQVQSSGIGALSYLEEHISNPSKLPDIIFLDIKMPLLNGHEFLHKLQSITETIKDKCKVVMLSSSGEEKDINLTSSYSNVIQFIQKPLTPESLTELKSRLN